MMPNDPTRRSTLSVALLAHANTGYEVDCWMAGNGQPNGSVRYDTDRPGSPSRAARPPCGSWPRPWCAVRS
jgi:hypothetical protein